MLVILLIALIQMPQVAVMPAIERISTEIFPDRSLQHIQTLMALISLTSIAAGIAGAIIIRHGLASKKFVTILGVGCLASVGIFAFFLNTMLWHIGLLNILIGAGMGFCIPNHQSILFDNFDEENRQLLSGLNSTFLCAGGVLMSTVGGLLITRIWFGGYLMTLIAIPVAIVSIMFIPRDKKVQTSDAGNRTKLPQKVFFYAFLIFLFAVMFGVGGMNISTHIANAEIGDAAIAGTANAMPMLGGIFMGLLFVKVSTKLGDNLLPLAFVFLFIGFSVLNLFHTSLIMTFIAMFMLGLGLTMFMPRCLFNISNITNPSNSSTATMLVLSIAPGSGGFLSPIIMTNLTVALGGDSTRFRYQFTAFICLLIAALIYIYLRRTSSTAKSK